METRKQKNYQEVGQKVSKKAKQIETLIKVFLEDENDESSIEE